MKKVTICVPSMTKPYQVCLDSIKASAPLLDEAGWEHSMVSEIGCPYISHARSQMLRKALNAGSDVIVFIDHDLSWKPKDLLTLIETEGDVVAGTYRYKREPEEYMGKCLDIGGRPILRPDGAISMFCVPAGFLKITKESMNAFIQGYPELCYGDRFAPGIDLFNHGAHNHVWYGEDYAFCRRWLALKQPIWCVPDLDISHHRDGLEFKGNFHEFLLKQPGGSNSENPVEPEDKKQIFKLTEVKNG